MKKDIKKITVFVCVIICLLCFSSCSKNLPDGFDKEVITERSQYVINNLSARNYTAVNEITRADLREALSPEVLSSAVEQILMNNKQVISFNKITIKAQKNNSTGEQYVLSIVKADYKNKAVTYTLGFDKDMNLIMLYLR